MLMEFPAECDQTPVGWPRTDTRFVQGFSFESLDFIRACHFFQGIVPLMYGVGALYVFLVVFLGPYLMRGRESWDLRRSLIFWNGGLALISAAAWARMLPETIYLLRQPQGIYKVWCTGNDMHMTTVYWLMILLVTKVLELGDTIFLILRKRPVIFLHWYHHITVLWMTFLHLEAFDAAFRFLALINSFVHALMYGYYALRAANYRIPKRVSMFITTIQLLQFIVALAGNTYTLKLKLEGVECHRPLSNIVKTGFIGLSYFILFGNFFVQTYVRRKPKGKSL